MFRFFGGIAVPVWLREHRSVEYGGLAMKRVGKPVFFIVAILIVALAVTSFCGIHYSYGDTDNVVIKGAGDIRWGIDIRGGVDVTFRPEEGYDAEDKDMDAAKSIIETRLVNQNITDYELYVDYNKDRIILRFPWKSDETDFDASKAIQELGETAYLSFREGTDTNENGEPTGELILDGQHVVNAEAAIDNSSGTAQYVVSLEFDDEGKEKFSEATGRLVGKSISIWMDNQLISAPTVNSQINDNKCQIQGNFDADSAKELASKIKAGALPFKLETDSYGTVNPTLGMKARDSMAIAGVIALALIVVFMVLYYRLPGAVASIALIGQAAGAIAAVSGYFSFFPSFTLTLPGIAGIILSIGMGVDCNVITNERIKEEIRAGKTIDGAIDAGNKNSFSAIFDGNLTNVIVAVILMGVFGPPESLFAKILSPILSFFGPAATGAVYSFGYTLLCGVILNFIFGLGASRLMLKSIARFKIFRKPWLYGGDAK